MPRKPVEPLFTDVQGQGSAFVYLPERVADTKPRVTFGEYTKALFDNQTMLGAVAEGAAFKASMFAASPDAPEFIQRWAAVGLTDDDAAYNPTLDKTIPEADLDIYLDSRSRGQTEIIREKLRREREARSIIQAEGLTGRSVAAGLVAFAPDIGLMWLGGRWGGAAGKFLTGSAEAAEGASLAARVGTGIATNLTQEAAGEAIKHYVQDERTLTETGWNLVGAGVIGGALPLMGAGIRQLLKKDGEVIAQAVPMEKDFAEAGSEYVSDATKDAVDALGDPNVAIAGKPMVADQVDGPLTPGWTQKLFKWLTPNQRRFTFENPEVGRVQGELLTYAKLTKAGGNDAVESRVHGLWLSKAREVRGLGHDAYKNWVKRNGFSLKERLGLGFGTGPALGTKRHFLSEVSRYVEYGADENILRANGIEPDMDILRVAKSHRSAYEDYAAKRLNASGIAVDLVAPEGSYGYFPHIYKTKMLNQRSAEFVSDFAPYIKLTEQDMEIASKQGLSPEAMQREIVERSRRRILGIDGEASSAGARSLKERRFKDIPVDVMRKWVVTDADEVMDLYMHRVGRAVELANKAPLSGTITTKLEQIAELEAQVGAGTLSKQSAFDQAVRLEREARALVDDYARQPGIGGSENLKRQLLDRVTEETAKRRDEAVARYRGERQSVDVAFSRKMADIRMDRETDIALAKSIYGAQDVATSDELAEQVVKLTDEYQGAVDDIRRRQDDEILLERMAARQDVADTVKELHAYREAIYDLKDSMKADKFSLQEFAEDLDLLERDTADTDIFGMEKLSEKRIEFDLFAQDYERGVELTQNKINALKAMKDALPSIKTLRESVRAADLKARLLNAADRLEGNLQNTDLAVEFFKARGEYLSSTYEAGNLSVSALSRLADIRDLNIQQFKASAAEQVDTLRSALRLFNEANRGILDADRKAIGTAAQGVRKQVMEKLADRSAAIRVTKLKDQISAIRRMEAERMLNPETWSARLGESYNARRAAIEASGKPADEINRLVAKEDVEQRKAKEEVENSVKLLLGKFGRPRDATGIDRLADTMRAWTYVTKMGYMTLTNAVDLPQPVLKMGWGHSLKGTKAFIKSLGDENGRALFNRMKSLSGAMETLTNERLLNLSEMGYRDWEKTAGETAMEFMAHKMGNVTGFSYLNDFSKGVTGLTASSFINDVAGRWADATKWEKALLRSWGIDDATAALLADKSVWADLNGVMVPDFGKIPESLADRVSIAINTAVDTTIVTPRLGQIALTQRTWYGKLGLQFKSFAVAQHESTMSLIEDKIRLGTPLERASLAASLSLTVGIGGAAVYAKSWANGKHEEYHKSPNKWLADSIDQSGVMGLFMEPNNMLENLSGLGPKRIGMRPTIFGIDDGSFRYKGANPSAYVLGPSADLLEGVARGPLSGSMNLLAGNRPTVDNVKQTMKILPYQNVLTMTTLPYELADLTGNVTGLFDLPEDREGIAKAMGAVESKSKRKKNRNLVP